MPASLSDHLVIGISSRALFDLSVENAIYEREGLAAYRNHQRGCEDDLLKPGPGFPLVKALLSLNQLLPGKRKVEVVVMSRNTAETSLRISNSIEHYGLDITRFALVGGASLVPYLHAFNVGLLLSKHQDDVQEAVDGGTAAALLYDLPPDPLESIERIRIAFDGDAVLFSDDSERIYQEQGLKAFLAHEKENARNPLAEGPFAKLLKTLSDLQAQSPLEKSPIRLALVTARDAPSHERVIRTLQLWNVSIDEAFFLGGLPKAEILKAFRPHIFFDDQHVHCDPAARVVPTGRVPYRRRRGQSGETPGVANPRPE